MVRTAPVWSGMSGDGRVQLREMGMDGIQGGGERITIKIRIKSKKSQKGRHPPLYPVSSVTSVTLLMYKDLGAVYP